VNVKLSDMKHKVDIEKRVEEVLNSLDGIRRAQPQPWFFSRIQARLGREEAEEKTVWGALGSFLSKPAVAIASLCMIILLNGFLLLNRPTKISSTGIAAQSEQIASDNESYIASSSSFDFENLVQP
jgi:hypothetical protein